MSSDSSLTEDEYEKIKEAVDENFLSPDLYANDKFKEKSKSQLKITSLRNQSHQEISNNPFNIRVTAEFQRHISKHLSRLLDEIIDDREIIQNTRKLKNNHIKYGIKLLCSSKGYLLPNNNFEKIVKSKKFDKIENLETNNYEKKAREVAVTPEWVLSQEETKCWASHSKGSIEIIKLDNCSSNLNQIKKKLNQK